MEMYGKTKSAYPNFTDRSWHAHFQYTKRQLSRDVTYMIMLKSLDTFVINRNYTNFMTLIRT